MTDETRLILNVKKDARALREIDWGDCAMNPRVCTTMMHKAADLIESLAAELEKVERERDAAVKDIEELRTRYFRGTCHYCKHHGEEYISNDCMDCQGSNWQWRGVKED